MLQRRRSDEPQVNVHVISWYTNANTIGWRFEQKTMYFRMIPLSLRGGSQETKTTELLEAAAFTPAGGPGTAGGSEPKYWFTPLSKDLH